MSMYRFNGSDPETTFGFIIEKGIDSQLLQLPELKDNGLSIDWADENGTERYLGMRRFKSKIYQVTGLIIAKSATDLHTKFKNLANFFITTGEFNFDDTSKGRRWKVFYNKNTSSSKLNSKTMRLTIELIDDYPTEIFTIS